MRVLILSDIHANLPAFEGVLADVKKRALNHDTVWCLGDVIGYGAEPNGCVELLRSLTQHCLPGNHDYAVLGKLDLGTFHEAAAHAVLWTRDQLTQNNREWLESRQVTQTFGDFTLVHGSPREPIWEYLIDVAAAEDNFGAFKTQVCLVGHTHVPLTFIEDTSSGNVRVVFPEPGVPFTLRKQSRYILNPGGVGQPRDGDPRAAYALLDTEARVWTTYRADYDVAAEQHAMREAGLPARLIERLEYGR
jgi:diadenosine tetraphosphatase ApaH/serine/threonine PP2A family protein phosphatase